jgi:hypothetical protein
MISTIIVAVLLAAVAWQGYVTVRAYKQATGTTWERLKAAFEESATIFWSRINSLSVLAVTGVAEASSWLGAPGVKDVIQPYLTPQLMLGYLLVVLIGAEIARRRSL